MAREFNGSSQYLLRSASVVTAVPFTIHAWFRTTTTSGTATILAMNAEDASFHGWFFGRSGTNLIIEVYGTEGSTSLVTNTNPISTNTWHAGTLVTPANNDRRLYVDGGNKRTHPIPSARTPTGVQNAVIGAYKSGAGGATLGGYWSGDLAEVAIWNVALSDAEVLDLYSGGTGGIGKSPALVQSANLVAYWKLLAADSNIDYAGANDMTAVGSPGDDTHPAIDYGGGGASPIPYLMQL